MPQGTGTPDIGPICMFFKLYMLYTTRGETSFLVIKWDGNIEI